MNYDEKFAAMRTEFERRLDETVSAWDFAGELADCMRYALGSGGKRLRPVLMLAVMEALGADADESAYTFAAAIECLHTYSLIHDDLPCMDDDDLRRGKPTCHIKYGESTAVLAGDALLNTAYELAFRAVRLSKSGSRALEAGERFALRAGAGGLISGQVADLAFDPAGGMTAIDYVYNHKTCDLIAACAECGALLAGADDATVAAMGEYGREFGYAFQLADDLIDGETDEGCSVLRVVGEQEARCAIAEHTSQALAALDDVKAESGFLREFALRAQNRTV